MEEKEKTENSGDSTTLYYGIGAAVLVLLVAGIYLMRPKTGPSKTVSPTSQTATETPLVRPTGPITGLACELQYYNPVIGFPKYYLSAEGADLPTAKAVDCEFTMSVGERVVGKTNVKGAPLSNEPSRGGKTFRCASEAVELEPNVPTVVHVALTDDQKNTATCSATFLFPAP